MRIVFMGTPDFAVPSLQMLLEHHTGVQAVVTVPDTKAGRGRLLQSSPVKQCALSYSLPVLQPADLKEDSFVRELASIGADLFVVVAFRILPPRVFTLPTLGAFNLHASLLPKYRGAAPIQWSVIRGEKETGVTTFFLKEKVDTGQVILQARLPIGENETAGELHDRLATVGAEIVLHTVRLIESGRATARPQDDTLASPAPKITREHCQIDWSRSAHEVHNLIRGLSPKPAAFTHHGQTLLKLYRSLAVPRFPGGGTPGEVARSPEGKLLVRTGGGGGGGQGAVEVLALQQEGKKILPSEEFLRGYPLAAGEVLT
jgi:methionyl-tRNA formyltransferase